VKLAEILTAPMLTTGDRNQIIAELTKHMGPGAEKEATVKNFLATLSDNNRLSLLGGVCEKLEVLVGSGKGEIELNITSASVCAYLRPVSVDRHWSM
jgi:F-type H+-transporting ATPase subunit O